MYQCEEVVQVEIPSDVGKLIHVLGNYKGQSLLHLVKALRKVGEMGLMEAKRTVDALIEGNYVEDTVFNVYVVTHSGPA